MTRGLPWLAVVLLLGVGCRKPDSAEPRPAVQAVSGGAPLNANADASANAGGSGGGGLTLQRMSEAAVPGLSVETGVLGQAARWGYSDLALDSPSAQLRIQLAKGGAELADLLPPGAVAVVNGGYFEADFRPTTWVVDQSTQLAPKAPTSKGGVLALGPAGTYLGPVAGLGFKPVLAVQSFPLVVEAEGKSGVYRDDGRRAARTIACLVGDALHFVVISAPRGDGPTLFEAAQLLREPRPAGFGCRRALNLDGGPSSGVWFAPEVGAKQRPPFAKVAYAIAILPR
jgi:hypothetical protein